MENNFGTNQLIYNYLNLGGVLFSTQGMCMLTFPTHVYYN